MYNHSGTSLYWTPLGPMQQAVLYREVPLIQRWICTQLYVVGTADSVLIREVSLIQSVLYREVALYYISC